MMSITTYDYSKLKGKIKEKYNTNARFAAKMGMSEHTLSVKLNNLSPFRQDEISKSIGLLDIPDREIGDYFFAEVVHNCE